MKSFLLFVFGLGAFVVSVVYMIAKVFGGWELQPGNRQWDKMIAGLRAKLAPFASVLIPWDGHDLLPLLELGPDWQKSGFFDFSNARTGLIHTIYQEPVAAVTEWKNGKYPVWLVRTAAHEFVFRSKAKEVEIWINSQPFGVLSGGALLSSEKNARILAQIESGSDLRHVPVRLGAQTALTLTNPEHPPASPQPRALTLLRDLNAEEEKSALALAILYQIRHQPKR